MSSLLQENAHATGVANADYIEVTIGTGHTGAQALTVGARLIISTGSYNNAQIDASHFSQQGGTATLGSFVVGRSEKRSGDGFSIAIVSAVVTGAGTATIRMDVTGNNYQNMHIGEWSGLGPAVYNAGGQNSTGTSGSTSTMNSAIYGRAFGAWTNATGTVTITPEGTWTDIHDFEDNSTTLCLSVISKAVSPGDAVTPQWTLSAGSSWIAAGVIFAEEQPDVFDFGGTSSPSPNTAVQSQTLNSPYMIGAGSRIYVAFAPWSTPANAAIDPTIAMVSDNLGNAASSYERLILLDTATYAGSADPNVPGIAWFESPAIASDVGAPTVTIDIDPGGSNTGYWTGAVLVIKNTSTDDDARIAAAVSDYRPTIADPGTIPTIVPFSTGDRDTDHSVVACFGFNRGHDDGADIEIPTQGGTWTKGQAWNEESSQFWSGLLAWLETTGTGSIAPTMVVSRNDGSTVTKTRGVMIIINLADGAPAGYTLNAEAGSFALAGTAASLEVGRKVAAEAGAYAVAGNAASLERGYVVSAEAGALTVTGTTATLRTTRTMAAASGSFAVNGTAATVRAERLVSAESSSCAVNGQAAGLVYSGSSYTLTADVGSFEISGPDAALRLSHVMAAASAQFDVTGISATLTATLKLEADSWTLTHSGQSALLIVGRLVAAEASAFALSGTAATFGRTFRVGADSSSYIVTGTDASLTTSAESGLIARTRLSATYRPAHTLTATLEV